MAQFLNLAKLHIFFRTIQVYKNYNPFVYDK